MTSALTRRVSIPSVIGHGKHLLGVVQPIQRKSTLQRIGATHRDARLSPGLQTTVHSKKTDIRNVSAMKSLEQKTPTVSRLTSQLSQRHFQRQSQRLVFALRMIPLLLQNQSLLLSPSLHQSLSLHQSPSLSQSLHQSLSLHLNLSLLQSLHRSLSLNQSLRQNLNQLQNQ